MELRYALPGKLSQNNQDAVFKTLVLRRLRYDRYKTLKAIDTTDCTDLDSVISEEKQKYVHLGSSHQVMSEGYFNSTILCKHKLIISTFISQLPEETQVLPFLPADFFTNLFNKTQNTSSLDNDTYASHLCYL